MELYYISSLHAIFKKQEFQNIFFCTVEENSRSGVPSPFLPNYEQQFPDWSGFELTHFLIVAFFSQELQPLPWPIQQQSGRGQKCVFFVKLNFTRFFHERGCVDSVYQFPTTTFIMSKFYDVVFGIIRGCLEYLWKKKEEKPKLIRFVWRNHLHFAGLFPSPRVFGWHSSTFLEFDQGRFPIDPFSFEDHGPPPRPIMQNR